MELLSYPIARILVSCAKDDNLIRRYATMEGKFAYKKLRREPKLLARMSDEFGITIASPSVNRHYTGHLKIFFTDYIRLAKMRHERWKLVNRMLDNGWVDVTEVEFVRLMQEEIRERIEYGLPIDLHGGICESLREYLSEIEIELNERKTDEIKLTGVNANYFPPCISRLLNDAQSGKNLSHSARFALTSFLLKIGMGVDEIIRFYTRSPDFDEEKTRYQVEHISKKGYTPPSCSKMKTYGICFDRACRASHPLGYYRSHYGG
jgi:DNA primase large subunit